jgi:hypothetical protein
MRLGSDYGAYARIQICRACGNYVPPGHGGCCSIRCTQYLAVASQPELGNSIFCQRDEDITCWGCQLRFRSSGIRYCPECYFRARPGSAEAVGAGVGTGLAPKSADPRVFEPISDRNPRSRCHW